MVSEGHARSVEEGDGRRSRLVLESLGIGQPGESVDNRAKVSVANLLLMDGLAGESLRAAAAVRPPAAAIGGAEVEVIPRFRF